MKKQIYVLSVVLFSMLLFVLIFVGSNIETFMKNDKPVDDTKKSEEVEEISTDSLPLIGFKNFLSTEGDIVSRTVYQNSETWQSYNIYRSLVDEDLIEYAQKTQTSMFGDFAVNLDKSNATVGGRDAIVMQYCELEPNYYYSFIDTEKGNMFVFTQGMNHDEVLNILTDIGGDEYTEIPDLGFVYSDSWCLENQADDDAEVEDEESESIDPLAVCDYSETDQNTCCSEFTENEVEYFQCSSNGYGDYGNCTWWVAYKRPDVGLAVQNHPGHGSACHFDYWANAAGFLVDDCARVGDVFVYDVGGCPGHVAYVEEVIGESEISVSEMNWCSTCMRERTFLQQGRKYIHTADPELVFYPNPPNSITELYGAAGSCGGESFFARLTLGVGELPYGIGNTVSAIHVPSGYSVKVYSEGNLSGESVCLQSDEKNLNDISYPNGSVLDGNIMSFEFRKGECKDN